MDVMILGKSGIGTSKAVIKIKLTRENAAEFCELYLNDTSAACAKRVLKTDGVKIRPTVSANCKTGVFTDPWGYSYTFKGRNKNRKGDFSPEYLIVDRKTGKTLDATMVSGYHVALGAFEVLCPKSLTGKSQSNAKEDVAEVTQSGNSERVLEEREVTSRAAFSGNYDAWKGLDTYAQTSYMMGVADEEMVLTTETWERAKATGLAKCIKGQGLTAYMIAESVTKYYETHTSEWAEPPNDVFVRAIVFDTCIEFINKELVSRGLSPWKRRG